MNIPYVMRKCSKCGRWLVASTNNFHRMKKGKYGLANKCKECTNKYNKQYCEANKDKRQQYYQDNREKRLECNKRWNRDNKDKMAEHQKRYYEAHKDKVNEYHKQYYQSPQGQVAMFNGDKRRRIREEQQGTGITKDQWLELMSFFEWRCAYSGEVLSKKTRSIDHIVPLNSGGEHEIWNLVPMTRSLNSSKHDKDMLKWYKEQDCYDPKRLAKIYEWQEYARKKWEN